MNVETTTEVQEDVKVFSVDILEALDATRVNAPAGLKERILAATIHAAD